MEESQRLITGTGTKEEEDDQEEFSRPFSATTASHSVPYVPPMETIPLGPPPEYSSRPPPYIDKPFPVVLQDGTQGVLVRDPTGMHVVCIGADAANQNSVQPNDHRCLAILAVLCVCFPLGIIAIWQSFEVSRRYANGDYRGAARASQAAYKWSIASLLLTLTTIILFFFIRFYFHGGYQYKYY